VYASLHGKVALALEAQHSVIVDAVYDNVGNRSDIEKLAKSLGTPFLGLWLQAEPATLFARVKARHHDASDATPDVVRRQLAAGMHHLSRFWTCLDAGGSPDATAQAAMAIIKASE
jgi:predicted kinase